MRATFLSILSNLDIPDSFRRKSLFDWKLDKSGANIKRITTEDVRRDVGEVIYTELLQKPNINIYKKINSSSNRFTELSGETLFLRGIVQNYLMALWCVKDNAVNSNIIVARSDDHLVTFNTAPLLFSDAKGDYTETHFDNEELSKANEYLELLLDNVVIKGEQKSKEEEIVIAQASMTHNSDKNLPYKHTNRLQRAVLFLITARSDSFAHAKITFYISALEALLSNANTELKMQVADRSARLLGEDFETKVKIYEIVSIAYAFRSSYIHGSVSKVKLKFLESVEHLCSELDDVLRRLVILFLKDLRHVIDYKDADFGNWLKEILYK